jgi:hypothetical protein
MNPIIITCGLLAFSCLIAGCVSDAPDHVYRRTPEGDWGEVPTTMGYQMP